MNAVCPQCDAALGRDWVCSAGHAYPVHKGIAVLLRPEDTNAVAAEFEAMYVASAEPWAYSQRGGEILKYEFIAQQATQLLGGLQDKCVVDIGCSVGGVTESLGNAGARVFALDISPTAVLRARERFPRADFCIASSTRLPLPNACADLAILSDGIKSWRLSADQIRTCMAETARILKPGAPAILLDYMSPRLFGWFHDSVHESAMRVDETILLGDRLYYTVERITRDLRLPTKFLANPGFARALRTLSQLGGRQGSKHMCLVARAR